MLHKLTTEEQEILDQFSNKSRFRQGYFTPRNPEKYIGDLKKLFYRSSWELHAFKFLDNNTGVIMWGSELFAIEYPKPVPRSKIHPEGWKRARYFPDLYVEYKHKSGKIIKELIEIKPLKQTKVSRAKKQSTKLQENYVHEINQTKWMYAKQWCEKRGIKFSICTEQELFRM